MIRMTTEISQKDYISTQLNKFSINDARVHELSEKYLPLKINGVDDKEGYAIVHTARMDIKNKRVFLDKTKQELTSEAKKYINVVNEEASRLKGLLEPIETHLEKQEDAYNEEKERIKKEKELREHVKLQTRVSDLLKFGFSFDGIKYTVAYKAHAPNLLTINVELNDLKKWDDEFFNKFICKVQEDYEDDQNQLKKIERQMEEERLAELARIKMERKAIAEQQEEIRQEQEAESKRLKAMADAQAEREAALKAHQEQLEAERRALEEEKQRIERELDAVDNEAQVEEVQAPMSLEGYDGHRVEVEVNRAVLQRCVAESGREIKIGPACSVVIENNEGEIIAERFTEEGEPIFKNEQHAEYMGKMLDEISLYPPRRKGTGEYGLETDQELRERLTTELEAVPTDEEDAQPNALKNDKEKLMRFVREFQDLIERMPAVETEEAQEHANTVKKDLCSICNAFLELVIKL